MFFSSISGINTGIENVFITEAVKSTDTVLPGMPSLPTMINFLFIAAAAIMTILNPVKLRKTLEVLGLAVSVIGVLAVAGYVLNIPLFYYYMAGVNSAMALNTAVLFVLLGIGLTCL